MDVLGILLGGLRRVFRGRRSKVISVRDNTHPHKEKGRKRTLRRMKTHLKALDRSGGHFTKRRKEFLDKAHKKRLLVERYRKLLSLRDQGKFVKSTVRKLYPEVQGAKFDLLFDEFECYGAADTSLAMFTIALFLTTTENVNFIDEVDIGFSVFDIDGSGDINRQEFAMLLKATTAANTFKFRNTLGNSKGSKKLLQWCRDESAPGVLKAFNAVATFKEEKDDRVELAIQAFDIIKELAGMSSSTRERLQEEIIRASQGQIPMNRDLFDDAMEEVIGHLEKKSFAQFQANSRELLNRSNSLFDKVDVDGSGTIILEEYMAWANRHPDAFRGLDRSPSDRGSTKIEPFPGEGGDEEQGEGNLWRGQLL